MKKLIISLILLSFAGILFCQQDCKVLLPSISGKYTGECRQGLAHGNGESTGTDFYRGNFAKGFPDGTGKYIWKDGSSYEGEWKKGMRNGEGIFVMKTSGKDSVIRGVWKEDKYVGAKKTAPYRIDYQNNIQRIMFQKVGDRPYLKFQFSRGGGQAYQILSNILLQGSSGNENNSGQFTGFEEINFPFKGKISFTAPNAFNAMTIMSELQFTVSEPGSWIVTITF